MYRVSWYQGNGYQCSCCRSEWHREEDFDTPEAALAFASNLEASREAPLSKDEGDVNSIEVLEFKEIEGPTKEAIAKAIVWRKNEIKAEKEKEAQRKKEVQEKRDLKELVRLQAKYRNV